MNEKFPRELTERERELLLWALPEERPGYRDYRTFIDEWKVAAQGRRGEGNYILAPAGELVDNESPLPQILAYGVVETTDGKLSVTLRERLENQLEYEILSLNGSVHPEHFHEVRRWSYSNWLPGQHCPSCWKAIRTVEMKSNNGQRLVLALCSVDQRIWIYDGRSGVNHLIPVSNFYNELMLHRNVRDPKIALDVKNLFRDLSLFTDSDLARAFQTYNKLRTKVAFEGVVVVGEPKRSFIDRLKSLFGVRGRK